jgi:hypothetical protein
MKPDLHISLLPGIRTFAHVKWYYEPDKFRDYPKQNVTFRFLKITNTGRGDAEDCKCTVLPPEGKTEDDGSIHYPMEQDLAVLPMALPNMEIAIGYHNWYEIGFMQRMVLTETSVALRARGGSAHFLLAFLIDGIPRLQFGVGGGMFSVPQNALPTTITLRTNPGGKLHRIKVGPCPSWDILPVEIVS